MFQMNVYFAFLGQNPQVHAFCKTGNLRQRAVCINNEALSPTVIILPNNLLGFCVKNCQLLSKYQLQVQPVHENLHLVSDNGNKRGSVAYGLTYLSFYRFSISLVALDFCNYPLAVWDMMALELCLNDVPAVSLWVIPRTAFMCECLLSSPLWNSFTLTSGVR